jgi:hypothetical protein
MKPEPKPKRGPGRPPLLQDGRRVYLYLDKASLERAAKLGDGNMSKGIREALAKA